MRRPLPRAATTGLFGLALALAALAALQEGYDDTPLLPGTPWHVHDAARPQPRIVEPGSASTEERAGRAPSDATVLFDGADLDAWHSGGEAAAWTLGEGWFEVAPGSGQLATREEFGDLQLHLEWRVPEGSSAEGQGRGNSGLFLMGRYELQILDSHGGRTYPDGQAAALYGQAPPLVNASRPAGQWQSYDVVFRAPRFEGTELLRPARVTVLHNGVLVHDARAFLGATTHRALARYTPHPPQGPLVLQDHGDPVRFRNIWVRPLPPEED